MKSFDDYLYRLSIKKDDFDSFFSYYNSEFDNYGNEVYSDIRSRLCHLKYFLEDSWWNNRFYFLFKYYDRYSHIIDLGFSVPYLPLYVKRGNISIKLPKLIYVDGNNTSERLAKIILSDLAVSADFVTGDLLSSSTWASIDELLESGNKLFTSFETIEHLDKPDKFWSFLHKYAGSDIILSLPIGPKIPSHSISFHNIIDIKKFIEPYLKIKEEKTFSGIESGSMYEIYTCIATIK